MFCLIFIVYLQYQNGQDFMVIDTVCPRSSDQFYLVTYYIKLVNTSWTDGIYLRLSLPDPVVPPPGLAEVGPVAGILRVPGISTHQAQIPRQ